MKKVTLKRKLAAARKKASELLEENKILKGRLVETKAEIERLKKPIKVDLKKPIPLKEQIKGLKKETAQKKVVKKRAVKKATKRKAK